MLNQAQDIQDALAYLNPDNREEWVKAGMAIKAEVGESGYSIWNEWGQGSATHKERDAQSVWKSFKKNGVGIGTLFGMAMDRGWQRPRDTPKTARGDPEQKAAWIWDHAKPAPNDHPYLVRKRVKSHGLRLHKESLTIPLRNVRGDLKTLQFILANPNDDGKDKLLLKDGEKQGAFFVIGSLSRARVALLCEGYATGASLHEHTGLPVAVCIDAGNLEPVALAIRGAYPRLRMLICGDHDAFKAGGNTGQEKAKAAAYALTGGANWCVPDFITPCDAEVLEEAGIDPSKSQRKAAMASLRQRDSQRYEVEKPTDFNDLANWIHGGDRVKAQIEAAIGRIGLIEVRSGDMPRVVRQAESELIFGGGVYQRSGNLVRVVRHDFQAGKDSMDGLPLGALRLCEITAHWLTERFATVSSWKRWQEREQAWKSIDPPIQYAATYLSKVGQWRAPVLTGIIECPTLRRDGTLLSKSGYDPPPVFFAT
jgi:putative DNA primase/helicase